MKKEIFKDLIIILITCFVTLGGSYIAFAQKVAKLETGKADVSLFADTQTQLAQVGEKLENYTQAQEKLADKVEKSAEKNEKSIEELKKELADAIEKSSDKKDKAIEEMRKQLQESSQKQAEDMGELKGKLEMLIKALNSQ